MGDTENANTDKMRNLQCSNGTSSSSSPRNLPFSMDQLKISQMNSSQIRPPHFQSNFLGDNGRRVGIPPSPNSPQIPPISPYFQIPISRPMNQQSYNPVPSHSRSLSQPSFFSLDSLPPLSPCPFRESPSTSNSDQVCADTSMEDRDNSSHCLLPPSPYTRANSSKMGDSLPPRKAHRRSSSDIPFGLSSMVQPSLLPFSSYGGLERSTNSKENTGISNPASKFVKREPSLEKNVDNNLEGMGERKCDGDSVDDLFSAYMNLDNIDLFNSSGTNDKNGNENREDLDSRGSGTKTNGGDSSDNEAESSVNESGDNAPMPGLNSSAEKREGIKRTAGGDIAPTTRHFRSVSMDSFMGKLQFGDESPKMPPTPPGVRAGQLSSNNLVDGISAPFSLEFGNGEFSGAELKKIMANDKLAEIALIDPKRAKRYVIICHQLIYISDFICPFLILSNKFTSGSWQTVSPLLDQKKERCGIYLSWNTRSKLYRQKLRHSLPNSHFYRYKSQVLTINFDFHFPAAKFSRFPHNCFVFREIQLDLQTRIMN